ncbi:hypothetical protein D3C87_2209030 [compost metagenome]
MAVRRHEERWRLVSRQALAEGHCLGTGGRLVKQRSIGDVHTGQVTDQRLEIQ